MRDTLATTRSAMKKYWHVLNVGIQNNLTYRFNFLARAVFGLIPLIAILYVWQKIYSGNGAGSTVGTYSLAQMISYYLLSTVVDALTAVNEDDWQSPLISRTATSANSCSSQLIISGTGSACSCRGG